MDEVVNDVDPSDTLAHIGSIGNKKKSQKYGTMVLLSHSSRRLPTKMVRTL